MSEDKKQELIEKLIAYSEDNLNNIKASMMVEDAYYEFQDITNRTDKSVYTEAMFNLIYMLSTVYYDRYSNGVSMDVTSKSQGDISISYSTDIPAHIMKRVARYIKCPMCRLVEGE